MIYLVFHPMGEPSYSRKRKPQRVSIPWNTSKQHKRKFIKRNGLWLNTESNTVQEGDLYFWGEYEAGSEATMVSTTKPRAIHDVLKSAQGSAPLIPNAQNTDPYVFGNHFKHICCGMRNRHYVSGDIILFGNIQNKINPNKFLLDTVFVVKDTCKVNKYLNTTQYYKASIEPLKGSKSEFYRGDMYLEGVKYYCYVPCLLREEDIYTKTNDVHPVINLKDLGFDLPEKGPIRRVKHKTVTDDILKDIWNKILNAVTAQGWNIGIYIDKV